MGLFTKTHKKEANLDTDAHVTSLPDIVLHTKQVGFKPRNFLLLGTYLMLLPVVLLSLVGYYLITLNISSQKPQRLASNATFQAVPEVITSTTHATQETEARVETLKEFFKRYDSPLEPYAKHIVDTADKYSLDWRLIPAIAMQESTLCKRIPKNSNNCWGFGIYGSKVTRFTDYETAIETVSKTLAVEYKEKRGLEQPHEIVTRYTPSSTTWADKVSLVMNRIEESM